MPAAKKVVLDLKGVLDIRQAESIYNEMKKFAEAKREVTVDFSEAEDIDMAVLQLLYSFKKTMAEQKKSVTLANLSEQLISRINLCDFTSLLEES